MKNLTFNSIENWSNMIIAALIFALASCQSNAETSNKVANSNKPTMTIHEATFMGNVEAVKAHVKAKTDLNQKDAYGSAPLSIAATFGKTEVAKLLIDSGADMNVKSADGSTPLHTSSFLCRVEIVKALLEKGADLTIRNNFGSTALESVSGPFQEVKMVYEQLSKNLGPFGLKLDFDYIEKTRPQVADMLKAKNQ